MIDYDRVVLLQALKYACTRPSGIIFVKHIINTFTGITKRYNSLAYALFNAVYSGYYDITNFILATIITRHDTVTTLNLTVLVKPNVECIFEHSIDTLTNTILKYKLRYVI